MRYVEKSNRHSLFDDFVGEIKTRLKDWEDLKNKRNKAKVRGNEVQLAFFQHLWQQQKGLCIYCQQEIEEKVAPYKTVEETIAQLEHICPQSHCEDLIFEQNNIAVSCEGFNLNEPTPTNERRQFCGHFKDQKSKGNVYDEAKFLNPTQLKNIESYFDYSALGHQILPNSTKNATEQEQANYMVSILGLNHPELETMRHNQYRIWTQYSIQYSEDWVKENLSETFDTLPSFHSMLKSKFL
jgi:uncharacterized protein (TIGR02646 family)